MNSTCKYHYLVSRCFFGCESYNLCYPFQEQLKESNQSFVFRLQVYICLSVLHPFWCTRWLIIEILQVADDSTLYGCCVLVEEIVQRPSKLLSMLMNEKPIFPRRSRYVITTPRCYCILSRLPFFELHFGVLQRYSPSPSPSLSLSLSLSL